MKKLYIIITLLLSLSFTACEKILDKEPVDKLSLEDLFKDIQGTKTALIGAYTNLINTDLYHRSLMIYPDLIAGNLKFSKTTNIQLDDIYNLNQDAVSSSLNSTYLKLYDNLNNINNIIKFTPATEGLTAEKNRVLAEAKCLRALSHFDLVRVFCKPYSASPDASHLGIVINLNPRLITDGSPSRSTIKQTYDAIIADLSEAIVLFDNSVPIFSKGAPQTFFNKNVAKALLAKVYLYSDKYNEAFVLADELIKSNSYTLLTNAQYVNSWNGRTPSSESIFELALEANFSGNSLGSYYETTNTGGFRMFAATNDILSVYSATDVRGRNSLFNTVNVSGTNLLFTKKYATGSVNATPVKLLRLSEMYLIRAEAAVEKTNPDFAQANSDLNIIAKRGDLSAPTINLSTKDQLIDAVLLERRKELAFEGNLLFDLLRKGKGVNRVDCNALTCSVTNTDYRLTMPLPASTVNVNSLMVQNQGY